MPVSTLRLSGHNNKRDNSSCTLNRPSSSRSSSASVTSVPRSEATTRVKCDLEKNTSKGPENSNNNSNSNANANVITQSLIPINFPLDLNLSLNCVLLQPHPQPPSQQNSPSLSTCASGSGSGTATTSSSAYSNSLSISSSSPISISSTSSASASPSSCYSSSSGFCDGSGSGSKTCTAVLASGSGAAKKYRLSIVKIEEEQEGPSADEEDDTDAGSSVAEETLVEKVDFCKQEKDDHEHDEERSTATSSYCLSTTADCDWDLDFDDVDVDFDECHYERGDRDNEDDDGDTDVEVTSSYLVSPCTITTNTSATPSAVTSDSNSNSNSSFSVNSKSHSKKRKKYPSHSHSHHHSHNHNHNQVKHVTKSDAEHSDESSLEYLSSENPNPVPCIHCQDNADHSIDESVIWPIQLDLDLVETLLKLCPEYFADFKEEIEDEEGEMEQHQDGDGSAAESPMDDVQSPSTSSSTSAAPMSVTGGEESGGAAGCDSVSAMDASPPHVIVDDSPLQESMGRNKESLKVKLLLRRPMNQLVEQGILPPPKTPPAFAGQRVRLERARMGDLLKAKIQQRPARQELIRQHILEDSNARVAPALAEKQRMLKKARLADSLNDHLIHRPGPLELVQKNILHAPDATIDQAIKEGAVCFKATSEGSVPGPQLPHSYLSEDDSSSDMSSPAGTPDQSQSSSSDSSKTTDVSNASGSGTQEQGATPMLVSQAPVSILSPVPPPPPPMPMQLQKVTFASVSSSSPTPSTSNPQMQNQILSRIVQAAVSSSTVPPLTSAQLTLSKLSQLDQSQLNTLMGQNQGQRAFLVAQGINFNNQPAQQQHACASKSRSSKKSSKPKSQPKARQIKFHEYKGPPSAQKGQQQTQQNEVESSYELLLQQQQLFLQWQLEWQHKYPQIILPAVSKLTSPTEATAKLLSSITAAGATISVHPSPPPVTTASISSVPTVLSPSTISSVPNQTTLQNIVAAPTPPPVAPIATGFSQMCQPLTPGTITTQVPQSIVTVTNTITSAESAKPQPISVTFTPVSTVLPKAPAEPKVSDSFSNTPIKTEMITAVEKPAVVNTPSSAPLSKTKSLSKFYEWKVNDLKAELKKRNLPVSGSKPQLIERLKLAELSLQDESVSTTTHNANSKSNPISNPGIVKTETLSEEVTTCYEMMDVSDTQEKSKVGGSDAKIRSVKMDIKPVSSSTNTSAGPQLTANAAIMALLQNNNIKLNSDGTLPQYVLNALASVIKKPDPKTTSGSEKGSSTSVGQNIVFVDEAVIREQRKHIEELQEALKNSQQQLLQMKSQQAVEGGGQKHRLALQQHLQHKMQQQALQAQLQKLQIQLQLHSLQQQQQQKNQQQSQAQSKQPIKVQLSQVSTKIQPQFPNIHIVSQQPQRAVSGSQGSNQFILPKSDGSTQNSQTTTQSKNIPYAIVKIAKNATTRLQTPEKDGLNLSDIPQIIIPDRKDASFQVGKNGSNQGSNTIPVPQVPADQTDQSWLLKIDEVKEDSKDSNKQASNYYNNANSIKTKGDNKIQAGSGDTKSKKKTNVKSQMVDDVLEILIRHGELPPSAAQEPPTPTTPGKSPSILTYPTSASDGHGYVPPPPPLPPATFAVTLPTSISFPKPCTASVFSGHPINTSAPSTPADANARVRPTSAIPTEVLSKEAQDILKISEDLSNFGKAHAENENRSLPSFMFSNLKPSQNLLKLNASHMSTDEDTLQMLLGEVEKDLHLVDDMDIVLDDHSSHHHPHFSQTSFHNASNHQSMHVPTLQDNLNQQLLQNYSNQGQGQLFNSGANGIRASEEFLEELGSLLPDDIDVTMPMEMDYSEWLEDLLPTDNNNMIGGTTYNGDSLQLSLSPFPNSTDFSGSNGDGMTGNSNMYGGTNSMDFQHANNNRNNSSHQRDPLLSSRSLNIFSSIPQNAGGSSCANSTLNALNNAIDVKSNTNRAPSPMAMGNDSLLWDFA